MGIKTKNRRTEGRGGEERKDGEERERKREGSEKECRKDKYLEGNL